MYTSPILVFLRIAGVNVAAAARFHTDISTKVVKKVEKIRIFLRTNKKNLSKDFPRKGCPNDRAVFTDPKSVRALSFCRKPCNFCSVT
jgi:hypothetical protein